MAASTSYAKVKVAIEVQPRTAKYGEPMQAVGCSLELLNPEESFAGWKVDAHLMCITDPVVGWSHPEEHELHGSRTDVPYLVHFTGQPDRRWAYVIFPDLRCIADSEGSYFLQFHVYQGPNDKEPGVHQTESFQVLPPLAPELKNSQPLSKSTAEAQIDEKMLMIEIAGKEREFINIVESHNPGATKDKLHPFLKALQ